MAWQSREEQLDEFGGKGTVYAADGQSLGSFEYHLRVLREVRQHRAIGNFPDEYGDIELHGAIFRTEDWAEDAIVRRGHTLELEDGRRVRLDIDPPVRGFATLSFTATPVDPGEFNY